MTLIRSVALLLILSVFTVSAKPVIEYLPDNNSYRSDIATPEQVMGFSLGERHVRHDQLLQYYQRLAAQSANMQLTNIGYTQEFRQQFLATISSTQNLARLPELLAERNDPNAVNNDNAPIVIWLGYSVHGDEISGAHASMAVAYHLLASESAAIKQLLNDAIIVIEPSINPDGMDRFVSWVNMHRGETTNTDPNHIEHHQNWPTGRVNHFGFDLNRDWLLLAQQESQNRLKYFHLYKPNVLGDFHEMGPNSSYFFQPGIPSRTHPITPKRNIELTNLLASYHAKALDQKERLYFTQESFDDFYYGKGSTYPDVNGGIGILFEQASSRGFQQETINGLLTFTESIENQVTTSLSTLTGAYQERAKLKQYRVDFYQQAENLAKKEKLAGYLLHESKDDYRLAELLTKLRQHQIAVYPLTKSFKHDGQEFSAEGSFFVPLQQAQYRLVKALFNQQRDFPDNTFYDVSGWTLPLAMNIAFYPIERTRGMSLASEVWQPAAPTIPALDKTAFGYIFEWHHYLAPKLLNALLAKGIKARVASSDFTSVINNQPRQFSAGSILLPAALQRGSDWRETVQQASQTIGVEVFSAHSGLTPQGIDFGSRSFDVIKPLKVLLVGGKGLSQYEAGELLFYLDKTLNIPVTVVEHQRVDQLDLSEYSHVLLVDGNYQQLDKSLANKLEPWVKQGGVLFAQKRAAKWLSDNELLDVTFMSKNEFKQLFSTEGLRYQDKEALAGKQRIAGAIFATKIDNSHPLFYGYQQSELPLFRNSTLMMSSPSNHFITVAKYQPTPLMSGYADERLTEALSGRPALVAHNLGKGRVIATTDVLAFRGYWHGSAKIIANSLFFGKAFNTPK